VKNPRRANRQLRRCARTGKRRFRDHAEAIAALHAAGNARADSAGRGLQSRRREIRCYSCGWCRGWHLTSAAARGTALEVSA
jgi:hypothetical protein